MPSAHDHREKAKRFLQMASDSGDPRTVSALKILAASHLESAQEIEASTPVRQQIQPKEPEPDDK